MRNFLGIVFIRTQTYSEIFKSALKYPSYRQYCLIFVAEKTNKKSKETNRIFRINQTQALGFHVPIFPGKVAKEHALR